jgi:hypothetical protein
VLTAPDLLGLTGLDAGFLRALSARSLAAGREIASMPAVIANVSCAGK